MAENGPGAAEGRFLHKDGRAIWFETRGNAVRDAHGNVRELQVVARDVTERRKAEETLRASESAAVAARDALRAVLDATTQYAIIGTDADGLITVFNGGAERMLGYRAEDVVGRRHPDLFHDREELERRALEFGVPVGRVLGHGTRDKDTDTRDWTLVRSDGAKLPVSLAITAIRDVGRRAHRLPRHRARHHGRAPGGARAARRRGALPQGLRPGADRQGARLARGALHPRQRRRSAASRATASATCWRPRSRS